MTKGDSHTAPKHGKAPVMSETAVLKNVGGQPHQLHPVDACFFLSLVHNFLHMCYSSCHNNPTQHEVSSNGPLLHNCEDRPQMTHWLAPAGLPSAAAGAVQLQWTKELFPIIITATLPALASERCIRLTDLHERNCHASRSDQVLEDSAPATLLPLLLRLWKEQWRPPERRDQR